MTVPDGKQRELLIREQRPFNAGPSPAQISGRLITPTSQFFVRNHADIPQLDVDTYRLTISGLVGHPLELSLDDLKAFPQHTLVATLQCAGNRRRELAQIAPIPNELEWDMEAISTAEWRGVRLRDVLVAAGILQGAAHTAFLGADRIMKDEEVFGLGGSVPLTKALHPDTLLAYEMNGAPLLPTHGYPLRALVPGYIGARSVKWLTHVQVQSEPSDNYYQAVAYRLYAGSTDVEDLDIESGMMLGGVAVTSVITAPEPGSKLSAGEHLIVGYAYAGEHDIARVEVSCDDGTTWQVAALRGDALPYTWRWWEARLALASGDHVLVARAWDTNANTQPEQVRTVWNFKGYMNNAWHRVSVRVR